MVRPARKRRCPLLPAAAVAGLLAFVPAFVPACSAGGGNSSGTDASGAAPPAPQQAVPVTAGINQLRDNYSKHIVSIELTNTSDAELTVLEARLGSALFGDEISWQPTPGGIQLPPGQTKSLPAPLPAPVCTPASGAATTATVVLRVAPAAGPGPDPDSVPGETLAAGDPYGVLARNNAEMCLARAADAVAVFRLDPGLEVSADGQSAVVRLLVTPREDRPATEAAALTVTRIEGTTLLAEDPVVPWPRAVAVRPGGPPQEYRLGIRPARCDPHAVAEDKVGTLLPLRVTVAGREGVLKVDAGTLLRGRIYDFVTAACTRQ